MTISPPRSVKVGSTNYLVGPKPVGEVSNENLKYANKADDFTLVTVMDFEGRKSITGGMVSHIAQRMVDHDDVMTFDFAAQIMFKASPGALPKVLDKQHKSLEDPHFQGDLPRQGPYFLIGTMLYEVFRLYKDEYNAFVCGLVQTEEDPLSYEMAPASYIAVPSRNYYWPRSMEYPYYGHRVAVKDIYDIRSVKTGAGSKAYRDLKDPASETAECIKKLIGLGAIIVGKTKTTPFASGMAAGDWEDDVCPTNPRGGLDLDPDCSSSGAAASVAGYNWLDYSIGSDSLGSITGPASACGVFGLRPTLGLLSNKGAIAVSALLDTPGPFTSNISKLSVFAKAWIGEYEPSPSALALQTLKVPKRVIMPMDFFNKYSPIKLLRMGAFIGELEKHCTLSTTTMQSLWHETEIVGVDPMSKQLKDILATTLATIQLYDSYHNNLPFRESYKAKLGREPKVDTMVQYKWQVLSGTYLVSLALELTSKRDLGKKLKLSDYEKSCKEQEIFGHWMNNTVLSDGNVILVPNGDIGLSLRNVPTRPADANRWQGLGLKITTLTALGGLPAVSFPVGQHAYFSETTKKDELQPISMMLIGPRGSDIWLIEFLGVILKRAGMSLEVKAGHSLA